MLYANLINDSDSDFKRLTGVHRATFLEMLEVFTKSKRTFGRPPRLCYADQLLLALMYWREYRTLFHTGKSYGISEAQTCKIVHAVEKALIVDQRFHLPGKKALLDPDCDITKITIDASESPIQRPKKDSGVIIAAKRSAIL